MWMKMAIHDLVNEYGDITNVHWLLVHSSMIVSVIEDKELDVTLITLSDGREFKSSVDLQLIAEKLGAHELT